MVGASGVVVAAEEKVGSRGVKMAVPTRLPLGSDGLELWRVRVMCHVRASWGAMREAGFGEWEALVVVVVAGFEEDQRLVADGAIIIDFEALAVDTLLFACDSCL